MKQLSEEDTFDRITQQVNDALLKGAVDAQSAYALMGGVHVFAYKDENVIIVGRVQEKLYAQLMYKGMQHTDPDSGVLVGHVEVHEVNIDGNKGVEVGTEVSVYGWREKDD